MDGTQSPNFDVTKAPDYRPDPAAKGGKATAGDAPFTVHWDGHGWLFAPYGMSDGPLPSTTNRSNRRSAIAWSARSSTRSPS